MKRSIIGLPTLACITLLAAFAYPPAHSGDVFVHLFEWHWNDIAAECENFLGPKGFDAVQISPPNEHIVHDTWWARYQPVSYQLDSRSGMEVELQDMIDRCAAAGVKIYADMVINHTAALNRGGTGTAGSSWSYENHPGLYGPNDYHDPRYQISHYNDAQHVWNGRLLELPDLNTGSSYVRDQLVGYFERLEDMGVEGFRVDAAKHMSPEDVHTILQQAGNPWTFLEVIGAGGEAPEIQPDRYDHIAHVTEFKYATDIASNFKDQIKHLKTLGESWGLLPREQAIVFVTNHDRERGHGGSGTLTYRDGERFDLAHVFMLAHPYGIAKVHTGYAFDDDNQGRPAGPTRCETAAISKTLNTEGRHSFSVTVTDDEGATDSASVTLLAGDPLLESNFETLFFRGTPNSWGIREMELVADHSWATTVHFDGQPEQRFKFDVTGDWSHNYGDNGADGVLDRSGADIFTDVSGDYRVELDDATLRFTLIPAGCNRAPTTTLTPSSVTVAQGESVTFDASGSKDVDGSIVEYRWSHGGTGALATIAFAQASSHTVTVTVTDDRGKTAQASAIVTVTGVPGGTNEHSRVFDSLNFRGTPNDWNNTAMQLVADNTWEIEVDFDAQAQQRFKFDVTGDWSQNYGDNDADWRLDLIGTDIYFAECGRYRIQVNDDTKTYTLTEIGEAASCAGGQPSAAQTLGAVYAPDKTTFSIWSPDHSNVKVQVDGQLHTLQEVADFNGYSDIYQVVVEGDLHLEEYTFLINGVAVRDPYGKMIKPGRQTNIVMDMTRTDPVGGWAPHPHFLEREDAVIYELHVRDFTIDASSGVPAQKRGKYLGLVEGGTRFQDVKTGLDHLIELGVTHVQLLPVYDFATCDGLPDSDPCYNWGYDPRNYNVPEERYSLTPLDYENRVREFKEMVNALHEAGIRVIMDVVYNHTFADEMFEDITDQYFYHQNLVVGNTIDDGVPMVSRMIEDSLLYWAQEYHIDGFRFDLVGIFSYDNFGQWARRVNAALPGRNILMYGEPWPGCFGCVDERESSRVRLGNVARVHDAHVGVFNPKYREALKGQNDNGDCHPGDCYVFNSNPDTWRVGVGSRGAIRFANDPDALIDTWDPMFAADPEQSINYVSAHDNLTLRDKILAWADANGVARSAPYLRRIQDFANGIVLTSQGIPFLHGGVELMRDKQGEHNSYDAGDEINKYRWQWKIDNSDVFEYARAVVAMRNAHPGFRLNTWQEIDENVTTSFPRYGVVVSHINGEANGDPWKQILVIYNSADDYTHALPPGEWKVAMEKGTGPSTSAERNVSGSVVAEGTAVTVLYKE